MLLRKKIQSITESQEIEMEVLQINNSNNLELTKNELKNCCQSLLKENNSENIRIINYKINKIAGAPTGFLGCHQILSVLIERSTPTEIYEENLNIFLKSAPVGVAAQMEYVEEFGAFKKEVAVYQMILPKLLNINVIPKYVHAFAPKCLLAKTNFLLFENLTEQGFKLAANRDGLLDLNHLSCGIKALANLHSSSIVHEVRTGKSILNLYGDVLEENAYPSDPNKVRSVVFGKACSAVIELIKIMPKYKDSMFLNKILTEFPEKMKAIFELCKTSKKYKNCLSHGDLWANNVMFKYKQSSEQKTQNVIECRIIDFQLARYAPPILDVITWITIPTSRQFRQKHFNLLLNTYYDHIKLFLAQHNIVLEEVISRSEFDKSATEYRIAGLIDSILFSHLTILPEEITKSMTANSNAFEDFINNQRSAVCLKAFNTDEIYRERLTDMVSDFIDNYILNE